MNMKVSAARFRMGDIVRHRLHPFRGVVFDVDPEFANTEEWYRSIPASARPRRDQPFYHLLAENDDTTYIAYVSEQNLLPHAESGPVGHPETARMFAGLRDGRYVPRPGRAN